MTQDMGQNVTGVRPRSWRLPMLAAGAALAAVLAGCAGGGSTPYQPAAPGTAIAGGYSDERIGEDRYRVRFAGNQLTSREQVEAFLLYRAAELTLQRGHDWFVIIDRETEREVRREPGYDPWFGSYFGYWRPWWRYYGPGIGWRSWYPYRGDPFWADRMRDRQIERYEASAEIRLGRGPRPYGDVRAFDAREVLARLAPRVQPPSP